MEVLPGSIVFFEVKEWEKEHILNELSKDSVVLCDEVLSKTNAAKYKNASIISSFIDSYFTKEIIGLFPNLKLIATRSTGFDHIDVAYCKEKGIDVANVPNYGQNTVAEHAMALLLALTKRIPESIERVRRGKFDPAGLTGQDLKDKIIGIVGTGNIGRNMITMSKGFGMNVLAYDAFPDREREELLGFTYVELEYLLKKSDFISIHVPYIKETHHLINREAIKKMKKGVVIINTSRGGIIETDALFDGLRDGTVGGAGLDVVEEEAFIKEELQLLHKDSENNIDFRIALENHMMSYFPNVIITPHNAFNTTEALIRIIKTTVHNIKCYSTGVCENLVKPKP